MDVLTTSDADVGALGPWYQEGAQVSKLFSLGDPGLFWTLCVLRVGVSVARVHLDYGQHAILHTYINMYANLRTRLHVSAYTSEHTELIRI